MATLTITYDPPALFPVKEITLVLKPKEATLLHALLGLSSTSFAEEAAGINRNLDGDLSYRLYELFDDTLPPDLRSAVSGSYYISKRGS